jgi:hypothetical protein
LVGWIGGEDLSDSEDGGCRNVAIEGGLDGIKNSYHGIEGYDSASRIVSASYLRILRCLEKSFLSWRSSFPGAEGI